MRIREFERRMESLEAHVRGSEVGQFFRIIRQALGVEKAYGRSATLEDFPPGDRDLIIKYAETGLDEIDLGDGDITSMMVTMARKIRGD